MKKRKECPICKNKTFKEILPNTLKGEYPVFGYKFTPKHTKTYKIIQCLFCYHQFANPIHDNIYKKYKEIIDTAYTAQTHDNELSAKKVLKEIKKIKQKGKLLDIGCSTGDFLNIAQKHYTTEGLELCNWATKIAKNRGHKIHQTLIKNHKGKYDIITLWGVIEHFENPKEEIQNIYRLLNKNGIVALWTGDNSSILARILKKKWWYYQGQHIQIFSHKSINKLFADQEFKLIYNETYPKVMSIKSIINSLQRYPLLGKIAKRTLKPFQNLTLTLKLNGEMYKIYQK